MSVARFLVVLAAIFVSLAAVDRASGANDAAFEASVRMLRRAIEPGRDGSNIPILGALRQLRDPALQPFFYQLIKTDRPTIQTHAALALAEIDPSRRINPWIISKQLGSPESREAAIASAILRDLIGPEQIKELLTWNDLEARPRLWLMAEKYKLDGQIDQVALARLAENGDLAIAGLASSLLHQLGNKEPFIAFAKRLEEAPRGTRIRNLLDLLESLRRYALTSLASWVEGTLASSDFEAAINEEIVFTLLNLDIERGVKAWTRLLGETPGEGMRVRYGMMLLHTGAKVPAALYDRILNENPLVQAIVRMGKALSSGNDVAKTLMELLDVGNHRASAWAMNQAGELPVADATRVYSYVIDSVERGSESGRIERSELAMVATIRLFEADEDMAIARLAAAVDDSRTQEAILLGLLEADSPKAGEAAASLPRQGAGRSDSIALLLMAKHAPRLDSADVTRLGVIAAGGGMLSEVLQAQAAWLYVRHTGRIDEALSRIFAD